MEDIKDIYFDIKRALPNDHEVVKRFGKALEEAELADAERDKVVAAAMERNGKPDESSPEVVRDLVEGIQDWNRGIVDGEELVQLAAWYEE